MSSESWLFSTHYSRTHTGREVTFEAILNSDHEMAPGLDTLTDDSPAPLAPDADGRYPVPEPGRKGMREY